MKRSVIFVPLLLALFMLICGCGESETYEIRECALSSFTAQDLDGNIIDESVYAESKVTMINVWGTFCEPCKEEIPALNELNSEYPNGAFQIIGIPINSYRTTDPYAATFLQENGITYKNIKVSNSVKPFINSISSVPYTIFINAEGYQIGGAYAGSKTKNEWKKIIDGILDFIN